MNFLNDSLKIKNLIHKSVIALIPTVLLSLFSGFAYSQNFSHIKTFGFDYIRFQDSNSSLDELNWLANRHDWIVGPKALWPAAGVDYVNSDNYDTIKNAGAKLMKYLPYNSIAPAVQTWLENWCVKNNYNPEDLYYHYYYDTTVRLTNGTSKTVPGYGGGSAKTLSESRLITRWNGGWDGINPSSNTFRKAFQALALYVVTVKGSNPEKYADGLFLDTFESVAEDKNWTSHPENTIELKDTGTVEEIYAQVRKDLVDSKVELTNFLRSATGNQNFRVNVNAAEVDYVYNQFKTLYGTYRSKLMDLSIEYLITTTSNTKRIVRLQQLYDDMENGRKFFIRSQTNYSPARAIPFGFTQFILATHYLINHPNASFFYHYGNAGNYGGYPYGNPRPTHWNRNMEVNIGVPVTRQKNDYWNTPNTNRFYEFSSGSGYVILAREYSNALVLAKFGRGGFSNIGTNSASYQLPGKFYRLRADNTYGPAITSITLGESEGAILIKDPALPGPKAPKNLQIQINISQ